MSRKDSFVFTSESVAAGHPDKICDHISDAIVDALYRKEPDPRAVRGAVETLTTTQHITIAGEYRATNPLDDDEVADIARSVVRELGFVDPDDGFDAATCSVDVHLHAQSSDIEAMVDGDGAGDQGLMFGYARRDTDVLMPLPIHGAHRLVERMDSLRANGTLPYLRPDGKSQLSVRYDEGKPVAIERIVLAVPHKAEVTKETVASELWEAAVAPIINDLGVPLAEGVGPKSEAYIVNGTGAWTTPGGPHSDAGLTGRKIIVDTYGGWGRHGGGAFSGKDPSKVDRSAAYMLRYVAKNVVAAGLAEECEVQIAYAIGCRDPLSLRVDTHGTGHVSDAEIEKLISDNFDLTPRGIIEHLDLRRPIFQKTAAYGHFGREDADFTWERTDASDRLREASTLAATAV